MSMINITNLTFAYEGSYDNIFENVSFQIDTDWKLGFTGRNGRGKTTFLNLLLGKYEYSGAISANVQFDYFPFAVSDTAQLTMDIVEEINNDLPLWQVQKELSKLKVDDEVLYRPFNTLSFGEQTKVLLCVLLLKENHFLLIDEPTNHLDAEARKVVSRYLKSKKGFILVSHDRVFLDNCIDHVLSINKTNIEIQKGNFSSWMHNKELADNYEYEQDEKLRKQIKDLTKAQKRMANWSDQTEQGKFGSRNSGLRPDRGFIGHKAAKIMKRSKNAQRRVDTAIEEKESLLKNVETAENLKLTPLEHHKTVYVQGEAVSIFYDHTCVVRDVSFTVEKGEKVAICGKNGSGKSSLLKLILGEDITHTGTLELASGLVISYVPQTTEFLKGGLADFAAEYKIDESLFKSILRKLDFSRVQFEKNMEQFSAGQKKKVLIAKSLCQQAHLYVWDEPLNYIDVLSRMQIEELITCFNSTMIFVEHDAAFLEKVKAKIVEI